MPETLRIIRLHAAAPHVDNRAQAKRVLFHLSDFLHLLRIRHTAPDTSLSKRLIFRARYAIRIAAAVNTAGYKEPHVYVHGHKQRNILGGSWDKQMDSVCRTVAKSGTQLEEVVFIEYCLVDKALFTSYRILLWEQRPQMRKNWTKVHFEMSLFQRHMDGLDTIDDPRGASDFANILRRPWNSTIDYVDQDPDNRRNAKMILMRLGYLFKYMWDVCVARFYESYGEEEEDDMFEAEENTAVETCNALHNAMFQCAGLAYECGVQQPRIGQKLYVFEPGVDRGRGWAVLGGKQLVFWEWFNAMDRDVSAAAKVGKASFCRTMYFGIYHKTDAALVSSYEQNMKPSRGMLMGQDNVEIIKKDSDSRLLQRTEVDFQNYQDPDNRRNSMIIITRIQDLLAYMQRWRLNRVDQEGMSDEEVETDIGVHDALSVAMCDCASLAYECGQMPRIGARTHLREPRTGYHWTVLGGKREGYLAWFDFLDEDISAAARETESSFCHTMYFAMYHKVDAGLVSSLERKAKEVRGLLGAQNGVESHENQCETRLLLRVLSAHLAAKAVVLFGAFACSIKPKPPPKKVLGKAARRRAKAKAQKSRA